MIELQQILLAAISAAGYSLVFYIKKRAKESPDSFDPYKLASTVVVGIAVGISFGLSGVDFGATDIQNQIAMYAGSVAVVESVLKTLYREVLSDYL